MKKKWIVQVGTWETGGPVIFHGPFTDQDAINQWVSLFTGKQAYYIYELQKGIE